MSLTIAEGTYAALISPRTAEGRLNVAAMEAVTRFVHSRGITSVAVNGATGEFSLTTPAELACMLRCVREASSSPMNMICGVGAASASVAKELARVAEAEGANGLLVPAPIFFRYSQDDLRAFVEDLAAGTSLPLIVYNLPQFSTGFSKETVASLIKEVPNVVGVKDSSGSLDILRHLTVESIEAVRFIGNDGVLVAAMRENLCDGVISGVACALPELIQQTVAALDRQDARSMQRYEMALAECVQQLDGFPAPWGVKWLLEAREVAEANFAQPISTGRRQQAESFKKWAANWFAEQDLGEYIFRES